MVASFSATDSNHTILHQFSSRLPSAATLGLSLFAFELLANSKEGFSQDPNPAVPGMVEGIQDEPGDEEKKKKSVVEIRLELLNTLNTTASTGGSVNDALKKIEAIEPLVAKYRLLLSSGEPPSFEELSSARSIIYAPINTHFYSTGIPAEVSRRFLKGSVFDFYADITAHFRKLAIERPDLEPQIASQLESIFSDTIWSATHNDPITSDNAIKLLESHFLPESDGTPYKTFLAISKRSDSFEGGSYSVMAGFFIGRHYDEIKSGFQSTLLSLRASHIPLTQEQFADLIGTAHHIFRHVNDAARAEPSFLATAEKIRPEIQPAFREPLKEPLLKLWNGTFSEPIQAPNRTGMGPWGIFIPREEEDPENIGLDVSAHSTLALSDFFREWEGCKVSLGDYFLQEFQRGLFSSTETKIPLSQLLYATLQLSPHPESKAFLVDSLRVSLHSVPSPQGIRDTTPPNPFPVQYNERHLAVFIAMSLLSDYSFCSTSQCVGHNPQLSGSLIRTLTRSGENLERYAEILTPAQVLLVEMLRIQNGGELTENISWFDEKTPSEQAAIKDRASKVATHLAEVIFELRPIEIFKDRDPEFKVISFPIKYRAGIVPAPDASRVSHYQTSISWFCDLGDCITESYITARTGNFTEAEEIQNLIRVTQLLESRDSDRSLRGVARCSIIDAIHARYTVLEAPTTNGPFFKCRDGVAHLLSPGHTLTINPDEGWPPQPRGSNLWLAHQYAQKAEARFVVNFALTLLGDDAQPTTRPLQSMQLIKGSAATRRVHEILDQYDLEIRDPKLRNIFEGKWQDIPQKLTSYRDELDAQLLVLLDTIKRKLPEPAIYVK